MRHLAGYGSPSCQLPTPLHKLWCENTTTFAFFKSEDLNDMGFLSSSNPPYAITFDSCLKPWLERCLLVRSLLNTPSYGECAANLHSRNSAVKLIHRFPSQDLLPLLTIAGIDFVSSSSIALKIPFLLRNPTIIFGTPRRKDWAQNFKSFRSNLCWSLGWRISSLVFSSTQLIGSSLFSGLQSQTLYSVSYQLRYTQPYV